MDAHLFRRFCDALVPRVMGARMEKIHAPGPGVTVFAMYGGDGRDGKRHLVLKADRKSPLLFSADHRIPVNAQPPAFVMRLRKHVSGRRITHAVCRWTERRLYFGLSGDVPLWLCLDLREGPSLSFDAPAAESGPLWPDGGISSLSPESWKKWQVLTPALRRTLAFLDPLDANALLMDLETGGGDVFLYENDGGRCEVSAWPLPGEQLAAMGGGKHGANGAGRLLQCAIHLGHDLVEVDHPVLLLKGGKGDEYLGRVARIHKLGVTRLHHADDRV